MGTRRAHLAALGLAAATPAAVLAGATAASAADSMSIVATRKQITLPAAPTLGVPYIATFDLTDSSGTALGTAWSSSAVVDVSPAGPVVFGAIVLDLADGQIHYQRVINRYGDYPRKSTGAILGGTGKYAAATGSVDVVWPDDKTIDLTVNLS
jgi:hypothetical protein